jgi:predicted amidohydrolase YtcJ
MAPDAPGNMGKRTIDPPALAKLVRGACAAGLQIAVHAIGDGAVEEVLQLYESLEPGGEGGAAGAATGAAQRQRERSLPPRIEHAQHISGAATASRIAAAGIAVTPNPLHLLADGALLARRLGAERAGAGRAHAYGTLLRAGVLTAFGSDWPVVELDPLNGTVHGAVHRGSSGGLQQHGGSGGRVGESSQVGWGLEEAVSVRDVLLSQTRSAAVLAGMEGEVGVIRWAGWVIFNVEWK